MIKNSSNHESQVAEKLKRGEIQKPLIELASDAVYNTIKDSQWQLPILLQRVNQSEEALLFETRAEMRQRWINNPSEYTEFSEEDIQNKISNQSILELYRKHLIHIQRSQDRLKSRIIYGYKTEIFVKDSPQARSNLVELEWWISEQTEETVKNLLKGSKFPNKVLEKALQRKFGNTKFATFETLENSTSNIVEQLWLNIASLSPEQIDIIQRIKDPYQYTTKEDIKVYCDLIRSSTSDTATKRAYLKEILKQYAPEGFAMKEAIEIGFIDESEAILITKEKLQKWIWNMRYFDEWSDQEKKQKEKWAKHICFDTDFTPYELSQVIGSEDKLDTFLSKDITLNKAILENIITQGIQQDKESNNSEVDINDGVNSLQEFISEGSKIKLNDISKIQNIGSLAVGTILHVVLSDHTDMYFRIKSIDTRVTGAPIMRAWSDGKLEPQNPLGIVYEDLSRKDGIAPDGSGDTREFSYKKLLGYIQGNDITRGEVISGGDFNNKRERKEINTVYAAEETEIQTIDSIENILGFRPEKSTIVLYQSQSNQNEYFRIVNIDEHNKTIKVTDDGHTFHTVSFAKFAWLKEILKIKDSKKVWNLEELKEVMKGMKGFEDTTIEWGKLYKVKKDKDGKSKKIHITHLKNGVGDILQIEHIDELGIKYKSGTLKKNKNHHDEEDGHNDDTKKKEPKVKGNPRIKSLGWSATETDISQFFNFIDSTNHGFALYIPTLDDPKDDADTEPDVHMHGSPLSKFLSGVSLSDMWKGGEMFVHAIEHKLEKNAKFNSTKFADRYLSGLMPLAFRGQLKSEMYSAQNEAMEGIVKMLEETMSGKEARLYVRNKILLNSDARFEEVLAGLLYLGKKTGQIYGEELSDMKDSRLWFRQLARTMGYKTKASRDELWDKCAAKSPKWELAVESDVIERVLKFWEGKEFRIPPNIAPKFAGYISEGIKDQGEKWEKEVNMLSNIDQMNDYTMSKLNVGEGHKALACLDRIYGKNGSPVKLNALPFTMVMSNMHEYLGTAYANKLHTQAVGKNIRSTHALAFGNDINLAKTYREMVMKCSAELQNRHPSSDILSDLKAVEKLRSKVGHESHGKEPEEDQKNFINGIYEFWKKHGDKLHPLLQMTDPFIQDQAFNNDPLARKYVDRVEPIAWMQRQRWNIKETDWFGEGNWNFNHTPPMNYKNYMHFAMTGVHPSNPTSMEKGVMQNAFPAITGALNALRDTPISAFGWSKERRDAYVKKMWKEYYISTMYYLRGPIQRWVYAKYDNFQDCNYLNLFRAQWFDFTLEDFASQTTIPRWAELWDSDDQEIKEEIVSSYDKARMDVMFDRFMSARPSWWSATVIPRVESNVASRLFGDWRYAANDSQSRQAA
jgi:hypothetical protein